MTNPVDDLGNVQVDFVWGNFPMQPDDARGENTLDPALDNHIIATTGYSGFPGFATGGVYDDVVPNATVPVLTGVLANTAATRLTNAGLVGVVLATTGNAGGATAQNNGKVASQNPAAGTVLNEGDEVEYSVYEYTSPAVVAPTNDWDYNGMTGRFYFNAISSIPGGVNGSGAMGYNLVITGGAWAGTYGLGNGAIDNAGPTFYVQTSPGFPAGSLSVDGAADGGLASIVAK